MLRLMALVRTCIAERPESDARVCASDRARSAFLLLWLIAWIAWPHPAFSEPVPIWSVFDRENSDLLNERVAALATGKDGALWVGTSGGLARFDQEGHWQSYTTANTNGGLPSNNVDGLAPGADGALWVGTVGGGLARLDQQGHWQSYTKANTNGGLPLDSVDALADRKSVV